MKKTLFMALAGGAFVAGSAAYQPADAQTRHARVHAAGHYHHYGHPYAYRYGYDYGRGAIVQHHLISHTYVTAPRRTTRVAPLATNPPVVRRAVR